MKRARLPKNVGYVYVVEASGRIKIGCTRNPMQRLPAVRRQGAASGRSFVSVRHEGYRNTELALHERFGPQRIVAEWFSSPFEIVTAAIADMALVETSDERIAELLGDERRRAERVADVFAGMFGLASLTPSNRPSVEQPTQLTRSADMSSEQYLTAGICPWCKGASKRWSPQEIQDAKLDMGLSEDEDMTDCCTDCAVAMGFPVSNRETEAAANKNPASSRPPRLVEEAGRFEPLGGSSI